MVAFRNAARLYVDDFEADAWLSADGVLMLMHDDTLERTTNCTGTLAEQTRAELSSCDAGYWFSPGQRTTAPDETLPHPARGRGIGIPTAQELIDYVASFQGRYRPTATIEIKNFDEAFRAAQVLVPMIQASGAKDRFVVQSFNPLALNLVKLLDSEIRTLYLTPAALGATSALSYAVLGGHDYASPESSSGDLDAQLVALAHQLGKQLVPWTPNGQDELRRLSEMGVDGLITDFPACLLALQSRLPQARLAPAEFGDIDPPLCAP